MVLMVMVSLSLSLFPVVAATVAAVVAAAVMAVVVVVAVAVGDKNGVVDDAFALVWDPRTPLLRRTTHARAGAVRIQSSRP